MNIFTRVHMPSLGGATGWLGSEPLDPDGLRGRVVLVDFWTLTCINWLRQEPYVRAWARAYRNDGLIVIGVHTPEFGFEHDIDLVREAVKDRDIDYPVAADNDYAVWSAFANHYWPALYFVDREGTIRDQHFGEGRYEESERVIQRLLGIDHGDVVVAITDEPRCCDHGEADRAAKRDDTGIAQRSGESRLEHDACAEPHPIPDRPRATSSQRAEARSQAKAPSAVRGS